MTTSPTLPGRRYRTLGVVVGGFYPFVGPRPSYFENAYVRAVAEIEWQASYWGADAVIGLRTNRYGTSYVLVEGTAVVVDDERYYVPQSKPEQERSRWPANLWDFLTEWTRDL